MLFIFIIIVIFAFIVSYKQFELIQDEIDNEISINNDYVQKTFDVFIDELKYDMTVKSDMLLSSKHVAEAFAKKERDFLYSLVKDKYEKLSKTNKYLKIVTFRLPDGSAFLRVHKPEFFGG